MSQKSTTKNNNKILVENSTKENYMRVTLSVEEALAGDMLMFTSNNRPRIPHLWSLPYSSFQIGRFLTPPLQIPFPVQQVNWA